MGRRKGYTLIGQTLNNRYAVTTCIGKGAMEAGW
jgi:hypothetical protein